MERIEILFTIAHVAAVGCGESHPAVKSFLYVGFEIVV
jgi:hypothetical protein